MANNKEKQTPQVETKVDDIKNAMLTQEEFEKKQRQKTREKINTVTRVFGLGAIFLLNTLVLARLTSTVNARSIMNQEPEPTVEQAPALPMAAPELPAQAPAAPEAPALPAAPAAPAAPAK